MVSYFFDTYALIEILRGNPAYKKYLKAELALTKLNLIELHYAILRETNEELANAKLSYYSGYEIPIDNDTIIRANSLRLALSGKRLSYADCIGYVLARSRGMKFLTGDRAFKGMVGVEWIP